MHTDALGADGATRNVLYKNPESIIEIVTVDSAIKSVTLSTMPSPACNTKDNTMKQTITHASQFRDAFHAAGRAEQFSYEALGLLFDYLEEMDSEMELDVVAICCEYSEDSPEAIAESYSIEMSSVDEGDIKGEHEQVLGALNELTTVIGTTSTGAIVYASNF